MSISRARLAVCMLALLLLMVGGGSSQSASGQDTKSDALGFFWQNATNLGPEDASKPITIVLWLNQRHKSELDALVRQMYQKGSPTYRQWLTVAQYNARFAPTADDAAVVRKFLEANHLNVRWTEKNNHFVMAQGQIADIQSAFHVQINRISINGEIYRANLTEPLIEGPAASLITAIQGLNDLRYSSHVARPIDPETGAAFRPIPLASLVSSDGLYFTGNCFRPPQTVRFTTPGGGPTAVYFGNRYGSDITSPPPNLPPCGYDANEMQEAYGLKDLYADKWDGTGQTVVIVDAYGSPTIEADANLFSSLNKLPPLNSSNFQIFYPGGKTYCGTACVSGNWNLETSLDVEWAHTVAPEASIALILTPDNSLTNLDIGDFFAIQNGLGSVISNSWGLPESFLYPFPSELTVENNLSELAAALGMSNHFSSADSGDYFYDLGYTTVSMPASAPFATAIGGTSLFLTPSKTVKFQTGWGNNETRIATYAPNPPLVPPLHLGFIYGAGGGTSGWWVKPAYQDGLAGVARMVPDIAYDADPYTGVEIVITDPTKKETVVEVVGGTSLACPMFSALWAIANQAAGVPLGQAAPYLYALPGDAINDITDLRSPYNVAGTITNPPHATIIEDADSLAQPLGATTQFVSALYNGITTRWYVLTFGTDSLSLTTGPGWDAVTGLGTPNGLSFINAVVAAASP
jgi:subtilase family serine protease